MVVYYPREVEEVVRKSLSSDQSAIIVGPRQAGKTTLLRYLSETTGIPYYNLESPRIRRLFENVDDVPHVLGKRFFLDEAQRDHDIGQKLKYLVDEYSVVFAASGSGSFDVKVKVSGELVGRAKKVVLLPLSFGEFVRWRSSENVYEEYSEIRETSYRILSGEEDEPPITYSPELERLWEEYVVYGGYPRVVLEGQPDEKRELLRELVDMYIERDVIGGIGIKNYFGFLRLLELLSHTVTSIFKFSTAQETSGITYKTLQEYLSILLLTFVVFPVFPLPLSRASIRKAPKFYFYDLGLRNAVIDDFRPFSSRNDRGAILENFVARALYEHRKIHYFRSKGGQEVDFIYRNIPVEVKTQRKVSRTLYTIAKKLETPHSILISPGRFEKREGLFIIPPWFL